MNFRITDVNFRVTAAVEKRQTDALNQGILKPGEISIMDIAHDDDCSIWFTDVCTCVPDLLITDERDVRWINRANDQRWQKVKQKKRGK